MIVHSRSLSLSVQRRHFVHESRDDADQSVQSARAAAAPWHDSKLRRLSLQQEMLQTGCHQFVITANEPPQTAELHLFQRLPPEHTHTR